MANNYTQSSFVIENLKEEEKEWIRPRLDDEWWEKNDEEYMQMLFSHAIEGQDWWIHDNGEHMDTDQVVNMVREFLARFRPDDHVIINVAYTCSRPRPDEFGGFSVLITAKEEVWFDPQAMAAQYLEHGECEPRVFDHRDNIDRLKDAVQKA